MHSHSSRHRISLGVNHAYVCGAAVHYVDFISLRIGRNASRPAAHVQSPFQAKSAQVNNRNRVALAIGDVGVLVIGRIKAIEFPLVEVPLSQAQPGLAAQEL